MYELKFSFILFQLKTVTNKKNKNVFDLRVEINQSCDGFVIPLENRMPSSKNEGLSNPLTS